MERFESITLNIPHSSTVIPIDTWSEDMHTHIMTWTDHHTDKLYKPSRGIPHYGSITPVICPVSRFFSDVERLENDPMEEIGQGIFYTKFGTAEREMEPLILSEAMAYRQRHLSLLSSTLKEGSLLIDCHSFPEHLAPNVDVCIGYNEDWSKPEREFIDKVADFFTESGFDVEENYPYSNSITPKAGKPYKSIMLEINKSLYLDESIAWMKPTAYKINQTLNRLYEKILSQWTY